MASPSGGSGSIPLHRRVFTAAIIGLSYAAGGALFHALSHTGFGSVPSPLDHPTAWVLAIAAAALMQWLVNTALLLPAIKGADPGVRMRDLLLARESVQNDVAELCVAVLVTLGHSGQPSRARFRAPVRHAASALGQAFPADGRVSHRFQDGPAQRRNLGA